MNTIYLTYGCPRSGKSTWAKKKRDENPGKIVRTNKDDLRAMLHTAVHSFQQEKFTVAIRDKIVEKALRDGKDVIVDDTNFPFGGQHFKRMCEIAKLVGDVQVVEKYFDAELRELIKRNKESLDGKPVPEDVIHNMFNKHVKGKPYTCGTYYFPPIQKVEHNPDLPDCIIFDVDGTLAHKGDRSAYDWKRVGEDSVDENVKMINNLIDSFNYYKSLDEPHENTVKVFIFTGRDGSCLEETEEWLNAYNIYYDDIFIRPAGNMEKDSVIKKRIYDENIKDKYNVIAIFDDRQQVVDMYRSLGLTVCQVNYGDF